MWVRRYIHPPAASLCQLTVNGPPGCSPSGRRYARNPRAPHPRIGDLESRWQHTARGFGSVFRGSRIDLQPELPEMIICRNNSALFNSGDDQVRDHVAQVAIHVYRVERCFGNVKNSSRYSQNRDSSFHEPFLQEIRGQLSVSLARRTYKTALSSFCNPAHRLHDYKA